MPVTRRQAIIGTLAGGGLALGYWLRPRRYPLPLQPAPGETAFDAWITIGADGVVTVAVPQLEMGQGITTLIPQIAAQELGADWRQMAVAPAPPSAHYANLPLAARWAQLWMPVLPSLADEADDAVTRRWAQDHAFSATADGLSLAAYEAPVRAAAATVRALLQQAAGDRWDVDWRECRAQEGFIVLGPRRLSFGELAAEAAQFDPPDPPALRPTFRERPAAASDRRRPRVPRLDLPAKVDGGYTFAGDVRLPDMVHAAIRHGPLGDAELAAFDRAAAVGTPGLLGVVKGKRWLAAVARDWWAAERALDAMRPRFTAKAKADTTRIEAALERGVRSGEAIRVHQAGNPGLMVAKPFALALRYDVAPALHATLETASATARLKNGRCELWLASQAPEQARRAVAEALEMNLRDVVLYPMPAGGSFDRRFEHEHAIEAATIARAVGKPVQLTWSRWQEHLAGLPRTPVSAVMAAKLGEDGMLSGWKARLAVPATARELGRRLFGGQTAWSAAADAVGQDDAIALEGAVPPYAIPNMVIEHVPVSIGLPAGKMRGGAHGYTAFFTECFIDELASAARREPLAFRMAMLGQDPRLAACLQRASALANWNGGGDGSGQGLACHVVGSPETGGRIAVVAIARRDAGGVRVDKISAVADIGRIVNLDIARQQIEGGLVFGAGLALGSATDYVDGLPTNGRLGALDLPRLVDCPTIEVEFVDSDAPPADPGELGVAVAAPAIANALFSATGLRFRKLPLLSEEL